MNSKTNKTKHNAKIRINQKSHEGVDNVSRES